MKVRSFKQEDLHYINARERFSEVSTENLIYAVSMVDDEDTQVYACFGAVLLWTGVAHIWGLVSDSVDNQKVSFFKLAKQNIEVLFYRFDIHRVQANTVGSSRKNLKFARLLGFEVEGMMKRASPKGENLFMLAIVR